MYNKFLDMLRDGYEPSKIFDGKFGEMMDVALVNDGPVTMVIDSREGMISTQTSSVSLTDSDKNTQYVVGLLAIQNPENDDLT